MRNVVTRGRGVSCPRSGGAGIEVEKRAALFPWIGRRPLVDKGGQIALGRYLPPFTIQTDLARAPAAIGLARMLLRSEDPLRRLKNTLLQVENGKYHKTRAFIRLASERCHSIILALPDLGNLCRADIISLSTFRALNKCAIRKLQLDPVRASSDIHSVTGSTLKIEGRIRGGLSVQLQGSAGTLHLSPLVSSNFSVHHFNLSQETMSRLKIQLRPNLQDGGHFVTQVGKAPLIHRGGMYSLNYEESIFQRISIFRYKNGWLQIRLKGSPPPTAQPANKRTFEIGQIALSERRGLKALGMENQLLRDPGDTPMVLTSDGFDNS